MTKTTTYLVSTFNNTDTNTTEYKGESRYQADLAVMNAIKENKHGIVITIEITENKEFDYKKEETKILKNF